MQDQGTAAHSGMRHRAYRGRMLYLTDGVGEMGREFFSVTVQPDGERTLPKAPKHAIARALVAAIAERLDAPGHSPASAAGTDADPQPH